MPDHTELIERLRLLWPDPVGSTAANALEAQAEEIERLTACLKAANSNHEHFEREWYLRGDEIEALRADASLWQSLYRRAINEANGLTNYVEDRPELTHAERRLNKIEADARTAIDSAMQGVKG